MFVKALIISALAVLQCPVSVAAGTGQLQPRDVCGSGIYGELAPILKGYPIAQSYCSSKFPLACTTAPKLLHRAPSTTKATNNANKPPSTTTKTTTTTTMTKPTTTTTTTKSTTTTTGSPSSAWSKCQGQGAGVVSTMCSCIIGPPKVRILKSFSYPC
jgi:hypothetical protein